MKNYLLTMLFVLMTAISNSLFAQWTLQSPTPTGRNLEGATFLSPNHIFVCGENHYLLESTNAGATWITRMSDDLGTDPYYEVKFSDPLHGYLTGNSPDALRTTNGGVTWIPMTSVPGSSMYHIDFITPTTGFISGNGFIAFTPDGGVNWNTNSSYPDCPIIYGMDFRDAQVGIVGGDMPGFVDPGPGIFKTTDAGHTWLRKFSQSANDVVWMNNTEALAIVGTSIFRSTNSGDTWNEINGSITSGFLDMERVNSSTIVGVSGKGDIWRSTDAGVSWIMHLDGIGDLPTDWSVSFFDNFNGLVAGQGGLMYSTTDGGITWVMKNNGMGVQIYDLQMYSNTFGIAACNNGYVQRTTNGGLHWGVQKVEVTGQIFGRDESLRGVSIVDNGFAVVAGPGGTAFKTTNGGMSWQSIGYPELPDPFWIEDVKFVDHTTGWVVGLDQDLGHQKTIYKTTDGGTTWNQAISSGAYMYSVDFSDPLHGIVTTNGASYFRTTNGGINWTQLGYPPYFTNPNGCRVDLLDQNIGWVVGWDGFVARTTNGGASFTIIDIGTTQDHLFNVSVVSAAEVWAVGRENSSFDGVVYHTTNAGANWTREIVTHYFPDLPYSISARPSGDIWIGGYDGRIFRKNGQSFTLNLTSLIQGFYDPSSNKMIKDTAVVYLRNASSPYSVVDSAKALLDSNGRGTYTYLNASNGVPYFLVLNHRNNIETWSTSGNNFVSGSLTYDFTTSSSQAFGNNEILIGTRYCIYNGDVNKDGIIDASDLIRIYNDGTNLLSGYIPTDLNGDNFADVSDLLIGFNNSSNVVSVIRP